MIRGRVFCALVALFAFTGAMAGDADEIRHLLDDFLANAGERQAHERFWADDLIYTSSAGPRTDKASILASFADEEDVESVEQVPVYTAEEVQLKWFDDVAVVAFKLVATPPDDLPKMYYWNTGTFVKQDGEWRVVAWQATKIPHASE